MFYAKILFCFLHGRHLLISIVKFPCGKLFTLFSRGTIKHILNWVDRAGRTLFICTPWVPIHLKFNSQQGPPLSTISGWTKFCCLFSRSGASQEFPELYQMEFARYIGSQIKYTGKLMEMLWLCCIVRIARGYIQNGEGRRGIYLKMKYLSIIQSWETRKRM